MAKLPRPDVAPAPPPVSEAQSDFPPAIEALFAFLEATQGPHALAYFLQFRIMELQILLLLDGNDDPAKSVLAGCYQRKLTSICTELSLF